MAATESEFIRESLSSARTLHRMLTLVCATILVVAASQSGERDYTGAIVELDKLAEMNLQEFIETSRQRVQSLAKGMDLADAYRNAFDSAMRHELKKAGYAGPEPSLNHEVFLPVFDENHVKTVLYEGTVENYRDLISENVGVEYVFVDPTYLASAFVGKIRDINLPSDARITGMQLVMRPPAYATHAPKTFHLSMALILAALKPTIGSYIVEVNDAPVSRVDTFDETRFQKWLSKKQLLDGLISKQDARQDSYTAEFILPQSRSVWSLVADKVPEEAKRVLLAETEKSRRRVSLFSVEIDAQWIILAGPLLAGVLSMSLFSHVRHLHRVCRTSSEAFCMFPWLPLFPDRISQVVSVLTDVVLPIVAFGWLLFRFKHIDCAVLCVAIPFSAMCVVFSYASFRQIRALKKTDS